LNYQRVLSHFAFLAFSSDAWVVVCGFETIAWLLVPCWRFLVFLVSSSPLGVDHACPPDETCTKRRPAVPLSSETNNKHPSPPLKPATSTVSLQKAASNPRAKYRLQLYKTTKN